MKNTEIQEVSSPLSQFCPTDLGIFHYADAKNMIVQKLTSDDKSLHAVIISPELYKHWMKTCGFPGTGPEDVALTSTERAGSFGVIYDDMC